MGIVRASEDSCNNADQVAGGGAAVIVEEAGQHAGRLTGSAPRRAPAADGDAVAVEDQRAVRVAACPPSRQGPGNRLPCPFRRLLDVWTTSKNSDIRAHAHAVDSRFSP